MRAEIPDTIAERMQILCI